MSWIRRCCSIVHDWRWPEIRWIVWSRCIVWWWRHWEWLLKERNICNKERSDVFVMYCDFFRCFICWGCTFRFLLSLETWSSILKPDLIKKINHFKIFHIGRILLPRFFHVARRAIRLNDRPLWLQDNGSLEMLLLVFVTRETNHEIK